jgi:hypothetical protein
VTVSGSRGQRADGQGFANPVEHLVMHGVGVQEIRGIAKLRFGTDATTDTTAPKDNGIVTIFSTNAPDA